MFSEPDCLYDIKCGLRLSIAQMRSSKRGVYFEDPPSRKKDSGAKRIINRSDRHSQIIFAHTVTVFTSDTVKDTILCCQVLFT